MRDVAAACDGGCEFDPYSPAYDRDPHPVHAHLRACHRVHRWEAADAWVLSHHADVDWLLKLAPVGTNDRHWKGASPAPDADASAWTRLSRETITAQEGETHARLRRHVSRAFTPRAAARLQPRIESAVRGALAAAVERGDDPVDLVAVLSSRIPMQVLGSLMGVPPELDEAFRRDAVRLQNAINPLSDERARSEADAAALRFEALIGALIERAATAPGEDLLSALVRQDGADGRLSQTELVGLVTSIIMAGAETTGSLVNHGVLALLRHPEQLARLRAEPARLPAAVEELARFDFPTKFVTRYALEPFTLGGRRIARGDLIFGALGAANRDPAVFADPDRLDVTRAPGPALTFGAGAHFCLGAALARAEAAEMIGQLVCGFPELALAGEPRFSPHFNIRYVSHLPVRLGAPAPGFRDRR